MVETGLPAGWEVRHSNSKNLPYYYNATLKQSRWEPPEGSDTETLKKYMAEHHSARMLNAASTPQGKIRASHLLVKHSGSRRPSSWREATITRSKEEAIEIIKGYEQRIKSGETTLGDLALSESDCSSARKRGDLGFFGRGDMQPEFEQAAFALKPGEVSGIVETASGVHLIERPTRSVAASMDEISPDLQWELDLRATEGALAEHPPEASQAEITDSDAANEANCLNGDNIEYNGDFGKDSQATVAAESEITGSYNGLSQLSSQNVTPNRPGPSNTYRNVSGTETQPNTPDGPVNQHVDTSPSQDAGDGAGTLNGLQPDNGTVPCDQSTFQALWERQFSSGFQDSPTKATQVGLGINTATETQQHPPALALSSSLNTPSKGTPRAGTKRDLSTYLAGNRGATYMPNPVIPN
ncbi:hypothetical protein KEM55_003928, partial [Ascosphaera atra]